ncbi:unnamed protein product [Miscanthus lutarioriparius]|uniref:F-box domain-containing protein n=1 Tax=Miscanthus lutarioriparius TaxID=422564 RepID=A0A811RYV4_9POAL|nr:unnamed protein product [Miscanthus lutarioriparius]
MVKTTTRVADLTDLDLQAILLHLTPANLLRAALACHRWRRAATRALPRVPPLLGYFFHPKGPSKPPPMPTSDKTHHPAVILPLDASSPRLSLGASPHLTSACQLLLHPGRPPRLSLFDASTPPSSLLAPQVAPAGHPRPRLPPRPGVAPPRPAPAATARRAA